MKKLGFVLYMLCAFNAQAQTSQDYELNRRSYPDSLEKLVNTIIAKEKVSDSLLLYCFPADSLEARLLFGIDYRKEKQYQGIYYEINTLWRKKCIENQEQFIYKFIELSEYIDGYFATDYYIDIEWIISKNDSKFCKILNQFSETKKAKFLLDDGVFEDCKN